MRTKSIFCLKSTKSTKEVLLSIKKIDQTDIILHVLLFLGATPPVPTTSSCGKPLICEF